jgi:prephenate dehydrogenase
VLESRTDKGAFDSITSLVRSLGARPVTVDPVEHDRAVALISHLPQLVASELSTILKGDDLEESHQLAQRLAASGWNDMTRLGGSTWRVWRDIILTNEPNISVALRTLISELQGLEEALAVRDFNYVRNVFDAANRAVEEQRARRYQLFDKM